jgi:hypothetical protein
VLVQWLPESAPRRAGAIASLRPRAGVPQPARRAFLATLPCLIAVWALAGLYLSLGPSVAAVLIGSNRLWGAAGRPVWSFARRTRSRP